MSAEAFLKLAHSYGLITAGRMEKILRQVASSAKPISAEKIGAALVKKEILTPDELTRLLSTLARSPSGIPQPPELEPLEAELEIIDDQPPTIPTPSAPSVDDTAVFMGTSSPSVPRPTAPVGQPVEPPDIASEVDPWHTNVETGAPIRSKKKGWLAKLGGYRGRSSHKRGNQWDSPLMLVGGGTLLFMLIGGAVLGWYLTRETGEIVFEAAEEDYRAQKYTNAIGKYERFLEKFPSHPNVSIARVRRSMARIRQDVESGIDWDRALNTASRELPTIKAEPAFPTEGRPDLSRLLPDVYAGFIDSAAQADSQEQKQHFLDQSVAALALIDNPEYLPGSLRKNVQIDVERTNEKAALILREINRNRELQQAVAAIKKATSENDTAAAYATQNGLLGRYPALANHTELVAAVQEITSAERSQVTVSNEPLAATTSDHPAKIESKVALADRKTKKKTGLTDQTIYAVASGALYGLSADDGSVAWRRWLGFANPIQPQSIDNSGNADAIAFDEQRHELLRLSARDGRLVWRLPLGESIAAPVIAGSRIAIASPSGRIAWVNVTDGTAAPIAKLPQKLTTGPGVDTDSGRIYQVGQHSSLYVLAPDTLECDDVAYVGHRRDSVKVPAVSISKHVFVAENGGDYSWLHVFAADPDGTNLRPAMKKIRLEGAVIVPMLRFGRRLLVVTDRGSLHVYNVDPGNASQPVREIAKTLPTQRTRGVTWPLIVSQQIFVADTKLARYELQASRGELVRKWIQEGRGQFVAPPRIVKNVLFTVERNPKSKATRIRATQAATGSSQQGEGTPFWVTQLGTTPSRSAIYDSKRGAITVVSKQGAIWDISGNSIRSGTSDQATLVTRDSNTTSVVMDDGRVVVAVDQDRSLDGPPSELPHDGSDRKPSIIITPNSPQRVHRLPDLVGRSATTPVSLGSAILVCSARSGIHAVNADGTEPVLSFQPRLSAIEKITWIKPAVVDHTDKLFVAATTNGTVYLVAPKTEPTPYFEAVSTRNVGAPIEQILVLDSGDSRRVITIVAGETTDQLDVLDLPSLETKQTVPIAGRVTWGPYPMHQGSAMFATDTQMLHTIDFEGNLLWSELLPFRSLVGAPLSTGRSLVLTSLEGHAWRIADDTGKLIPWATDEIYLEVGEPLGAGAAWHSNRILLLGRDSTLFLTELPQAIPTASR